MVINPILMPRLTQLCSYLVSIVIAAMASCNPTISMQDEVLFHPGASGPEGSITNILICMQGCVPRHLLSRCMTPYPVHLSAEFEILLLEQEKGKNQLTNKIWNCCGGHET
jgi:hypothetical protein